MLDVRQLCAGRWLRSEKLSSSPASGEERSHKVRRAHGTGTLQQFSTCNLPIRHGSKISLPDIGCSLCEVQRKELVSPQFKRGEFFYIFVTVTYSLVSVWWKLIAGKRLCHLPKEIEYCTRDTISFLRRSSHLHR